MPRFHETGPKQSRRKAAPTTSGQISCAVSATHTRSANFTLNAFHFLPIRAHP